MELKVNFFLPGLVKPKGRPRMTRPRMTRTGHAYTPTDTRAYESALAACAAVAMGGMLPFAAPLAVILVAVLAPPKSWPAWKRKAALQMQVSPTGTPDLDNLAKTLDALNGIVWSDDSYVVDAVLRKRYGTKPGLHVMVRALPKLSAQGSKLVDLQILEKRHEDNPA